MADFNTQLSDNELDVLRALKPGSTIDLQISTPTSPKRMKTTYIGMEIGRGVLVQLPMSAYIGLDRKLLETGTEVVVRFVVESKSARVVAYRVAIVKVVTKPMGIIFLSFPKSIESMGLRSEKRRVPGIATHIRIGDEEQEIYSSDGLVVDVSPSGCRMAIPKEPKLSLLTIDTTIDIEFVISQSNNNAEALVRNYKETKDYTYYGLQFIRHETVVDTLVEHYLLMSDE